MYKLPLEKAEKQSQHMRTSKTGKVFSAGSGGKVKTKSSELKNTLAAYRRALNTDDGPSEELGQKLYDLIYQKVKKYGGEAASDMINEIESGSTWSEALQEIKDIN